MPDTPDTKRAATCPTCGSDDPAMCKLTIKYGADPRPCNHPFHSPHPVSAERKRVVPDYSLKAELEDAAHIISLRHLTSEEGSRLVDVLLQAASELAAAEARAAEAERRIEKIELQRDAFQRAAEFREAKNEHLLHGICDALDEGTPTKPILRALLKGTDHEHHRPTPKHPQDEESG